MIWPAAALALAAGGLAAVGVLSRYARRSDTWGATAEEIAAELPGDGWLDGGPPVRARLTRAAWIEAPAATVWPWVAQMGRGAGWYSYDRLDNGGRRSADHIVGWVPEPRPGDATAIGYLRHLEPGREIAWWLRGIDILGARFRGTMLYRVTPHGDRSRLLARFQADIDGPLARPARWLFRVVDGFMARRQLAGFKRRAESWGDRRADPARPETGARDQYQLYQAIWAAGGEAGVHGREKAAEYRRHAIEDGVLAGEGGVAEGRPGQRGERAG